MKSVARLMILGLAFLFAACSTVKIASDYDPEYDFTKMKNYRWASAKELNPNDILTQHPLVYKRIKDAVDRTLKAKGYNLTEHNNFNFVILAHAGSKEKMQVHQSGGGYYRGWYDPWWGSYGGQTTVSYYEETTLVLDIVSWGNKELAWRGMATGTVDKNPTPESMQKNIDDVVVKILAKFPPGAEKE